MRSSAGPNSTTSTSSKYIGLLLLSSEFAFIAMRPNCSYKVSGFKLCCRSRVAVLVFQRAQPNLEGERLQKSADIELDAVSSAGECLDQLVTVHITATHQTRIE